jgi:nucleotide-binding universal stress UspA family protein
MDAFKHVLVPIDVATGSPSALALGGEIARAGKAQLSLLHVHSRLRSWERVGGANAGPLDGEERARVLRDLRKLAQPWQDSAGGVNLVMREGEPGTEITAFAEAHGVDLVALETEGPLRMESVAERVLRSAHCSILAIHPGQERALIERGGPSEIVCALDLSPSSGATLDQALALAAITGARVTLLHVVDAWHWDDAPPIARVNDEEARRLLAESANEQLSQLMAGRVEPGAVEAVVTFGRPPGEIVRVASQYRAGVIAMGVHSQATVARFFLGPTAQAVRRAATAALLLVRAPVALPGATPAEEPRHAEV